MKAFITGGAGFIGSYMADRLLLGPANTVTIFDNFSGNELGNIQHIAASNRFNVILGDLLDQPLLNRSIAGHDIVYHFAANPDIAKGAENTKLDLENSVLTTYNLLEAMRTSGIKKLVFLSGSGIYGDTNGQPTGEDFGPLVPVSMYGAAKLGAEAYISAFSHMFGITSYIFRPANVVGARQTHGVAYDFIHKLKENPASLTILGDGKQSKSYLHVEDLLNAIFFVMAMVEDRVNIFNIATDDLIDVNWIAQAVAGAMKLANLELNCTGGERGWPGDVPVVRLSTSKIRKFGWSPRYNSAEAMKLSIKEMLERMKEQEVKQGAH